MTALDILRQARALIADPAHHHLGEYAADIAGRDVPPESERAVRWSLMGSLYRVWPGGLDQEALKASRWLHQACRYRWGSASFHTANKLGHSAVLAVLDQAIADLANQEREIRQVVALATLEPVDGEAE